MLKALYRVLRHGFAVVYDIGTVHKLVMIGMTYAQEGAGYRIWIG